MSSALSIVDVRKQIASFVINEVERRMVLVTGQAPRGYGEDRADFPTFHHFTPGMYAREIHMAAGSIVTSYVHRYEHPYVVSQGDCFVFTDTLRWQRIVAPYFGITKAGTRRLLVMSAYTIWTTFHATSTTEIEALEREIFITPDNPFLRTEGAA